MPNTKLIIVCLQNFYSYYNCGVMSVLNGMRDLPDTASKYANQVLKGKMKQSKFSHDAGLPSNHIPGGGGCQGTVEVIRSQWLVIIIVSLLPSNC